MRFCEACGGILIPKKGEKGSELQCRNCKAVYTSNLDDLKISERHEEKANAHINITEKGEAALPVTEILCNDCGHKEAYWWLVQTRSSDEAETRFFKCVECGNTWREYD